jgi:hypothetical protein
MWDVANKRVGYNSGKKKSECDTRTKTTELCNNYVSTRDRAAVRDINYNTIIRIISSSITATLFGGGTIVSKDVDFRCSLCNSEKNNCYDIRYRE